jgi:hypothetical protein
MERKIADQTNVTAGVNHPNRDRARVIWQHREIRLGSNGRERPAVDLDGVGDVVVVPRWCGDHGTGPTTASSAPWAGATRSWCGSAGAPQRRSHPLMCVRWSGDPD